MGKKLISKKEFAKLAGVTAAAVTKGLKGPLAPVLSGSRIDLNHPDALDYIERKTTPRPKEPLPGVDPLFEKTLIACRQSGRWSGHFVMKNMHVGYNRACQIVNQLAAAGHCKKPPEQKGRSGQSRAPRPVTRAQTRSEAFQDDNQIIEIPDDIESMADLTLRELVEKFGTGTRFFDWLKALKEIEAVNEKRIKNAQSRGRLISRSLVETGVIDPFNSAHIRLLTDGAKTITAAVLAKHEAAFSEREIEDHVTDVIGSFIRPVKSTVERNLASVPLD